MLLKRGRRRTDKETNEWFRELMGRGAREFSEKTSLSARELVGDNLGDVSEKYRGLTLRILSPKEVRPFVNSVPIYDLDIAAGLFGETQMVSRMEKTDDVDSIDIEQYSWAELPDSFRVKAGQFVARVVGESMNRRIPNGSWCLFSANPVGSRQGKIVLVQHRRIEDPDNGGHYTIKLYQSEKVVGEDGGWQHSRIKLMPESTDSSYKPMIFDDSVSGELIVIAEMVAVLC